MKKKETKKGYWIRRKDKSFAIKRYGGMVGTIQIQVNVIEETKGRAENELRKIMEYIDTYST